LANSWILRSHRFGWFSTTILSKPRQRCAILSQSWIGIERSSKKLLALYSLSHRRDSGLAVRAILSNAKSIWCGIAPGGVGSTVVCFHRSHMEQRNGHSAPIRKRVVVSTIAPNPSGSSATKNLGIAHGETGDREGLKDSIRFLVECITATIALFDIGHGTHFGSPFPRWGKASQTAL